MSKLYARDGCLLVDAADGLCRQIFDEDAIEGEDLRRAAVARLIEHANLWLAHGLPMVAAIKEHAAMYYRGVKPSPLQQALLDAAPPEPAAEATGPEACRKHLRRATELLATIPISADDLFELRDQLKAGIDDLEKGGK